KVNTNSQTNVNGAMSNGSTGEASADGLDEAGKPNPGVQARTDSFTKVVDTPHMDMSITHSKSFAADTGGDVANSNAFSKAKVMTTPGNTSADTFVKTKSNTQGEAQATSNGTASASWSPDTGADVSTGADTSADVQ